MLLKRDADTVCAISTAPGLGGIAVLRISGSQSAQITRPLCPFLPEIFQSHKIYYGHLINPSSQEEVDEVLVSFFAEGKSFTGEQTLEISCHGGQTIAARILDLLIQNGARLAERGEFTYRAFMNGKLDLVQAESVLQLIESQSEKAARLAYRQLRGEFSEVLKKIEDQWIWVLAHLEANIDFAAEDISVAEDKLLLGKLSELNSQVSGLVDSYKKGRVIREGLEVALVGAPNVGKSSLLNFLLEENRSIVTEVPGTTRDFVEGRLVVNGQNVLLIDTAGLRETEDQVEKIGIEKTKEVIRRADLIFQMIDASLPASTFLVTTEVQNSLEKAVFVFNKTDVLHPTYKDKDLREQWLSSNRPQIAPDIFEKLLNLPQKSWLSTSAKERKGRADVLNYLEETVATHSVEDSSVVTNARHYELLDKMRTSLIQAQAQMREDSSPEFTAFELHEGLLALHEILGKKFDDQVMDRVFQEFCLGK